MIIWMLTLQTPIVISIMLIFYGFVIHSHRKLE